MNIIAYYLILLLLGVIRSGARHCWNFALPSGPEDECDSMSLLTKQSKIALWKLVMMVAHSAMEVGATLTLTPTSHLK